MAERRKGTDTFAPKQGHGARVVPACLLFNVLFMSKNFLFRLPSGSGDFACVNGEIESAENVRLRLPDGTATSLANPEMTTTGDRQPIIHNPTAVIDLTTAVMGLTTAGTGLTLPAAPVVRFALKPEIVKGWHSHIDNLPSKVVDAPSKPSVETWGAAARKVFAEYERDAEEAHLFTRPFLALSAVRLRSGERILPSMPVLLIPQRMIPYVAGSDNFNLQSMNMSVAAMASRLRMSVTIAPGLLAPELEAETLEIFVSAPIDTFFNEEWISYHRSLLTGDEPQAWRPRPLPEISVMASMLSRSSFRPVGSMDLRDIPSDGTWCDVAFNIPPVPDADGNFSYRPDYLHLQSAEAAGSTVISKRLTLWDLTLKCAPAPAVASLYRQMEVNPDGGGCLIDMEILKEGSSLHSVRYLRDDPPVTLADDSFPHWLFFPDKDIRSVTIVTAGGSYRVRTHPHPVLEGSYFCCGDFSKTAATELGVEKTPLTLSDISYEGDYISRPVYRMPDAVWRSGKESRFYFADKLLMRVDDERVIALCRAFRASGLVAATAPTAYLFTTGGIYLVREMDDGTFRDVGLIAAYVLRDADSINVAGRILSFVDVQGMTYIISGTTVKLSETNTGTGSSATDPSRPGKTTVLIEPDGTGLPVKVISRPIKLGDKVKDLLTVGLLGSFSGQDLKLTLYASGDMADWQPVASVEGKTMHGIYAPGLRYCRIGISGAFTGRIEGVGITC